MPSLRLLHAFLFTPFVFAFLKVSPNRRWTSTTLLRVYSTPAARLKELLQDTTDRNEILILPCCYDGLSARVIAGTGNFQATFMTGFGVSAVRGYPDTQLVSFVEMLNSCQIVAEALDSAAREYSQPYPIPCIAVRTRIQEYFSNYSLTGHSTHWIGNKYTFRRTATRVTETP